MPTVEPTQDRDVLAAVDHAHQQALAALDEPGARPLAAVTWLSVHLAAVEEVLYRAAEKVLPDAAGQVAALRAADHRLVQALWRLDRRLTGDVHQGGTPVDRLTRDVRELLATHDLREQELLAALTAAVPAARLRELSDDLDEAMRRSPTRPHPDVPRALLLAPGVAWAEGLIDRARDLMDSRPVPTPRPAPVRTRLTRWGSYATAGTWPARDDATDD